MTRRAIPKSSTFTAPSSRIITFSGFTSRCTMPGLVRRAERARDVAEPADPALHRDARVADVRAQRPADDELHRDVREAAERLGLLHLADVEDGEHVGVRERRAARASRRRRAAPSVPGPLSTRRIFSATRRASFGSRAR